MLAHTLSRASPSTALQEICLFTDFAPIGHISSFHPFASLRSRRRLYWLLQLERLQTARCSKTAIRCSPGSSPRPWCSVSVMTDSRADARSTGWTWIAAIWCAGALFNASQTLLTMHAVGVGKAWLRPFLIVFVSWLPWALATPFVVELARRWPVVRGEIFKAISLHLAAFAAISVTAEGWSALLRVIFNPWQPEARHSRS